VHRAFVFAIAVQAMVLLSQSSLHAQISKAEAVQTHLDSAASLISRAELEGARTELDAALKIQKKTPMVYYWRGMIAIERGKPRNAEREFLKAARMDKSLAAPYKGLGDAYLKMKNRKLDAIAAYNEALKRDPQHAESQYRLAAVYLDITFKSMSPLGFLSPLYVSRGRKALEATLVLDPNHPKANHDLGMLYEVGLKNVEKAIPFYVKQIEVNPSFKPTIDRLGRSYFKTGKFSEGVMTFNRLIRRHPQLKESAQPVVIMLQATMEIGNGQFERAQETFELYIATLPPEEQRHYQDITYVASFEDQDYYRSLSATDQSDFKRKFWKQRDADPTTPVNERLVEHYRRVLYARSRFGEAKIPWDRRGEIFVRYGEPDDRQSFTFSVGEQSQANQGSRRSADDGSLASFGNSVRDAAQSNPIERHAFTPTGNSNIDAIREMNFQQRYQLGVEASTVGISAFRAESWVYVTTGTELYFVDQLSNGVFDFPLMTESRDVREFARQGRYHPARIAAEMIRTNPEVYSHDFGGEQLKFFYDTVSYQGEGNSSDIEVAVAVPLYQLGAQSDGRGAETSMEARLVMQDEAWLEAAAVTEHFGPFQRPTVLRTSGQGGALTTFQIPVAARGGEYQLAVAIRDLATRKIGIYRGTVNIDAYTSPDLMVSDLKLASKITPTIRKRGPFIRNGLEIVPNPTHAFPRNHLVHVYYELYNLSKNEEGTTSFRTEVSVTTVDPDKGIAGRLISSFGNLIDEPESDSQLTISLEDESIETNTARYTAMDLSDSEPGNYRVDISVSDLIGGIETRKSVLFSLADAIAEGDTPVAHLEGGEAVDVVAAVGPDSQSIQDVSAGVVGGSSGTVTRAANDSTLATEGSQSWQDLMRILQVPDYTLALDDSGQTVVEDTTISEYVARFDREISGPTDVAAVVAEDAYRDMVYVPAGMFLMGSDEMGVDEGPMQAVFCEPFFLDRHEVTNSAYKEFIDATQRTPPRHWADGMYQSGEEKYPVVGVSWYDAQAYAQWIGKRLPSETEWEKAARGDDGRRYPWGDDFVADWLNVGGEADGYEQTAPIGSFPEGASPYGIQDMAGNVWEWTNAWFKPYRGNESSDAAFGEQYRVIRGGSWINFEGNTRVSNRGKYYPSDTSLLLGFRCAKDPDDTAVPVAGQLKGYGYVLVATPGTWADIFVNGERLGQTPQSDPLRLRPGTHTLELRNPFYQVYTRELVVEVDIMRKERAVLLKRDK
jgi:GWxTD domain-containing protein